MKKKYIFFTTYIFSFITKNGPVVKKIPNQQQHTIITIHSLSLPREIAGK